MYHCAWLAYVDEHRTTVQEVRVQDPDRTHTQGLKITEENVLPLLRHLQAVRHSSLLRSGQKNGGPVSCIFLVLVSREH